MKSNNAEINDVPCLDNDAMWAFFRNIPFDKKYIEEINRKYEQFGHVLKDDTFDKICQHDHRYFPKMEKRIVIRFASVYCNDANLNTHLT